MFKLHPQLSADSVAITRLELCEVRLIRDANYPWLILVPQREAIREIHELCVAEQHLLTDETSRAAKVLQELCGAKKMNVAALGNMVPQLHIHVVARFESDAAWPGAIWGAAPALAYSEDELARYISELSKAISACTPPTA
tara:strand:+ start:78729 stop:79151 length:423 start_codon:yes stop_codon:yes gene_type:complete